jgi:hypothetical protein
MSTMLVELYDALKEAGASEAKARASAVSFARPDERLDRIERNLAGLGGEPGGLRGGVAGLRKDIARFDKNLAIVKAQIGPLLWMNGFVIAGVLALIIKTFFA